MSLRSAGQVRRLVPVIVSESFVVADWTDPSTHPGRPIAGLHLHRSDDEAWFVLEGRLEFRVGEEVRSVGAGESILDTRGTPHFGTRRLAGAPPCP